MSKLKIKNILYINEIFKIIELAVVGVFQLMCQLFDAITKRGDFIFEVFDLNTAYFFHNLELLRQIVQ